MRYIQNNDRRNSKKNYFAISIFIELDNKSKANFERQLQDQDSQQNLPRFSIKDILSSKDFGIYYFNTEIRTRERNPEEQEGETSRRKEDDKEHIILEFNITKVTINKVDYRMLEIKDVSQVVYA